MSDALIILTTIYNSYQDDLFDQFYFYKTLISIVIGHSHYSVSSFPHVNTFF